MSLLFLLLGLLACEAVPTTTEGCLENEAHEEREALDLLQRHSHSIKKSGSAGACGNSAPYVLNGTDTKCAYSHSDRLFRVLGKDLDGCYHECKATANCHYFSVAEAGPFKGFCMGCAFGVTDPHHGFNFYAMCPGVAGECSVSGDPHIQGFDTNTFSLVDTDGEGHDVVDVYGHGAYWLVKSDLISVQALYNKVYYQHSQQPLNHTYMTALAVGGAFLKGHTLIIEPANGEVIWKNPEESTQSVLAKVPSSFTDPHNLIRAKAAGQGTVVDEDTGKAATGLDITLPDGVGLHVDRFDRHLDMRLTMPRQAAGPGDVDGQCGNYNGDESDDDSQELLAMKVKDNDWLIDV
eukprot:CAMPEP_0178399214 /NCGR_PEP_ID=MMETSP0689_2-20121128/15167_1 /TAXON_ID=160604 /ORGANISM="Amphidinium massartii, Strain CS-259" /LENGTH=349 /DNA_ID=CAMNT_0020019989 /DNA_START=107 /DNA_END=1156 /DNA_ORIENTATION=+